MKFKSAFFVMSVVALAVCLFWSPAGALAQQPRTITVVGSGQASMAPTHVLIRGRIEGIGDTSNAAYESFRTEREKIREKLRDSKDGKLRISYEGEKLTTPSALLDAGIMDFAEGDIGGGDAEEFAVMETVVFKLAIENDMEREQISGQLTKLLDRVKEIGVKFVAPVDAMAMTYGFAGSDAPGMAEFTIEKPSELRHEAYRVAAKDARLRAERLAELAGGKIGRVVSIEELGLGASDEDQAQLIMQMYAGFPPAKSAKFSSSQNRKISVEQNLKMVFELTD